jgi:membrane protein implicated in regulation of membrane protease activity
VATISYWYWFGFAALMLILEMTSPGAFFLWIGLAAVASGILDIIYPNMYWPWQLFFFSIFMMISLFLWWKLYRNPKTTTEKNLDHRGMQYLDRVFVLDEAITNGVGKIKVDDTMWKVHGEDCVAGTRVKVTGVEGVALTVEKAE